MRWKPLLAVLVILGIASVLVFTEPGRNSLWLFGNSAGQFFSSTGFSIFPRSAGNLFSISLKANKAEFYNQIYNIRNSSIFVTGDYRKITIDDQIINLKGGEQANIIIRNMDGEITFLGDGTVKISAKSNSIEVNDYTMVAEKPKQIIVNIFPNTMLISYFETDRIVFDSITGELRRFVKENTDQISLSDNKVEISRFSGFMRLDENGAAELTGLVESVKGNGFAFSAS